MLKPNGAENRVIYASYLRSQVQRVAPIIGSLALFFSLLSLIAALKSKETKPFKKFKTEMDQNVAYFFVLFTFAASILIPYGLSKRWSVAIEFIIPAYACCYALFILPTFWWNGKYKKFLTGKALY